MSPTILQLTDPVGRIVMYVREQLNGQYRSQASGGSCRALRRRKTSRSGQ